MRTPGSESVDEKWNWVAQPRCDRDCLIFDWYDGDTERGAERMPIPSPSSDRSPPGHFPTTRWSRVVSAVDPDAPDATEALASLCDAYWYPIYAFVRRQGHSPDSAQDLTQEFFAYILEQGVLSEG